MRQYYTDEKNVLILIALLKEFGIKRVIASPGSTNVTFVGSLQYDPYFEMYSCVDERSAAYMACGLAAETQEPVVLSCTGATASRNYFPALTEAYYRNLPVLAVTSTQEESRIGNLMTQVIDRSCQPKDIVRASVHLQTIKDDDDKWDVIVKANKALTELSHYGGGPVHINLTTRYSNKFTVKELPHVRKISRIMTYDKFPLMPKGKVAIFVGTHLRWTDEETVLVDDFCSRYNAVVFSDPSSNYNGQYRVDYSLASTQRISDPNKSPDLLIHIGNMSDFAGVAGIPKQTWRVSPRGEIQDKYHSLTTVFEMPESVFFKHYVEEAPKRKEDSYLKSCLATQHRIFDEIPELPFSHIYVASRMYDKFPKGCTIHLGILSPLRSWSYFSIDKSINVFCNQGGFGIDGNMSTFLGASLAAPERLFFAIVGDLSFFYDLNSLGNRHRNNNMRILLINNALGAEFHLFKQLNSTYVNHIDKYLSAGGHFGHQSPTLVRHYAEDLGYEYLAASSKEEFDKVYMRFLTPELTEKPMLFEVFTQVDDENEALWRMFHIEESASNKLKEAIKRVVPAYIIKMLKNIIHNKQ